MERIILWNLRKPIIHRFLDKLNLKAIGMLALVLMLQSVSIETFAQNLSITGKVTDDSGAGIPGASVLIKGTTLGTATNFDGVYTLSDVPADATLVFSFIGMLAEELQVEGRTTIDIMLTPDLIGLDEVVVVGYGSMKKADLTGSVSSLGSDDLITQATPNITSTLSGKLTGVIARQESGRPGGDDPKFTIRGKSTYGNNDALVLVDGIEREFSRIDPNDIESITVLKDAASAAIYGSRGANGVILVTTKRGTNAPATITYSGSYTLSAPSFKPTYMNAGEYAKYINEASSNVGGDSIFTAQQEAEFLNGTRPSTDWWGAMMDNWAPMKQHNISATGGSDRSSYFMSLGFIDQQGLYDAVDYKRYNVRSNVDTKISDNLKVGLDIAARTDYTSEGTVSEDKLYQTLQTALPYVPAYVPIEFRAPGDELGLNSNGAAGSPMGEAEHSGYKKGNNSFLESKIGVEYSFKHVPGLKATFDYSYDKKFYNFKEFATPYTLNFYTYENGLTLTTPSSSSINLNQTKSESTRKTLQSGLNYDKSFGEHSFTGILLIEQSDYRWDKIGAYREGYISDAIDQIFAGADLNKDNLGEAREEARRGYIGRIAYNYNNKYLLQANARYDGSYNFPEDSRWALFPAFSAGWRISEENFMSDVPYLSNLKLRGSWGQFGNDKIRIDNKDVYFPYLTGYEYNEGAVIGSVFQGGIRNQGLANENITWETATSSNIGLEFGFFDGKLSGEFDYFRKSTTDILMNKDAAVPATFGAKLPAENLGEVDNWGYEGLVKYENNLGDYFFSVGANLTYATSEVKYIAEAMDVPDQRKLTGQPFDVRIGYISEGLFKDSADIANWAIQDNNENKSIKPGDIKYRDTNGDTIINADDRIIFGQSSTPKLVFGLNFDFEYKGFALVLNFQGAAAYDNYKFIDVFQKEYNSLAVLGENSFREGNEDAKYPRLEVGRNANNSHYSSFWMYDGFYIKLRNIALSYTITNNYLDNIGIENIILSTSGRNILTLSGNKDFDPENPNMNYPIMKMYTFGVVITY